MLEKEDLKQIQMIMKETIDEAVDRSVAKAVDEAVDRSVKKAVDEAVDRSVKKAVDEAVDRSVKKAVDEAVDRSVKKAVDEAVDRSVKKAVNKSMEKSMRVIVREEIDRNNVTIFEEMERYYQMNRKDIINLTERVNELENYYRIKNLEDSTITILLRTTEELRTDVDDMKSVIYSKNENKGKKHAEICK